MSQVPVKYAKLHDDKLTADEIRYLQSKGYVPVVPLSALREVVEGLELLSHQQPQRSHPLWGEWVNGTDYRSKSFKQWLAHRLLASLGEVKDVPEIGFGNRKEA